MTELRLRDRSKEMLKGGRQSKRMSRMIDLNSVVDDLEKNYEILEELGRGKFAVVKRCLNKITGQDFAAKFIKKRKTRIGSNDVHREVCVLQRLSHEHIIRLFEAYDGLTDVVLILELVSGGELFQYLVERERVTEEESTWFVKQVLEALKYMHQSNVVHLDIKPENVVLCNRREMKLKLIDFGLSIILQDGVVAREITGTPEFVAPEVINFDPLTSAADMWSVGVMTYIMLSGCSPFLGEDDQDTLSNVSRGEYDFNDKYFFNSSHLSRDFIDKLLIKNPKNRATAVDCLNHSWIKSRDDADVDCKRCSTLNVAILKSFIAKRRWRQSFHIVSLYNHLHRTAIRKQERKLNSSQNSDQRSEKANQRMSVIPDYDSE